jgi:hypothetical protein
MECYGWHRDGRIVAKFKSFPVPIRPTDIPLVQHNGFIYKCTGCGADIPDGTAVYETIKDGMVVGLRMRGGTAPDGPIIHECGEVG